MNGVFPLKCYRWTSTATYDIKPTLSALWNSCNAPGTPRQQFLGVDIHVWVESSNCIFDVSEYLNARINAPMKIQPKHGSDSNRLVCAGILILPKTWLLFDLKTRVPYGTLSLSLFLRNTALNFSPSSENTGETSGVFSLPPFLCSVLLYKAVRAFHKYLSPTLF